MRQTGLRIFVCGIAAGACVLISGCGDGQRIEELTKQTQDQQAKIEQLKVEINLDKEALTAKQAKIENLQLLLDEARAKAVKPVEPVKSGKTDKTAKPGDKAVKPADVKKHSGKAAPTGKHAAPAKHAPAAAPVVAD